MEERREKERKLRDARKEFENQMKRQTREVKSLRNKYFEALRTVKIFETKCTASEEGEGETSAKIEQNLRSRKNFNGIESSGEKM